MPIVTLGDYSGPPTDLLRAALNGSHRLGAARRSVRYRPAPKRFAITRRALPKTRSGKIMRRILRKIAENEIDKLGDTSTLADPSVVDELVANRPPAKPARAQA